MIQSQIQGAYRIMFKEYPDMVTVAQLQKMLGISRHQAYDLINDGSIPGLKIGNAYKVPKVNVISYTLSQNCRRFLNKN